MAVSADVSLPGPRSERRRVAGPPPEVSATKASATTARSTGFGDHVPLDGALISGAASPDAEPARAN